MRNRPCTFAYGVMLMLGMAGSAVAQDNVVQQPSARQQLQHIHALQSIDEELAHLTKDLELTPKQVQVRPLLDEHHDRIQALLDKNPTASRQELEAQIHAISTMKRTTRFMLCLLITRRNWKRRCSNASIVVKKTGDLLRLRQHRPSHLLRTLDISGSLSNGSAL